MKRFSRPRCKHTNTPHGKLICMGSPERLAVGFRRTQKNFETALSWALSKSTCSPCRNLISRAMTDSLWSQAVAFAALCHMK